MKRYQGEALRAAPNLAVVTNDNLGNFVIATPLMQMLRARHGGTLHYFGGIRVSELAEASPLVDRFYPLHGSDPRSSAQALSGMEFDLVVNVEWTTWAKCAAALLAGPETAVCGPCLGPEGRADLPFPDDDRGRLWLDQEWVSADVTARYPFLRSTWIAEFFCRLAYADGDVPAYALPMIEPDGDVPDVWISATASLPEKLWPLDKWLSLLERLKSRGKRVGLLGAKPQAQAKYWQGGTDEDRLVAAGVEDYRGAFTLPGVVGAISKASLVVTLDNGIMHLACATNTPVAALFREGIDRLWAPPVPGLRKIKPAEGRPVSDLTVEDVVAALSPEI
ncbi:MAG: glycosyltransferase family 9 protein [Armatimonadetes bacterium]|nr:glycosyltransferase family 9 protein [Armatimonadota bacterium]